MLRKIFGYLLLLATIAGAAHAAGPVDSCALINPEQLGKILNAQVGPGVMDPKPRPHCNFAVSGKGMLQTVSLWVYHESAKQAFENGKAGLAPIQAVAGLGDEAYYGMQLLNVLKGPFYMQVQLIFPKGVDALTIEKQIAAIAVPKLP